MHGIRAVTAAAALGIAGVLAMPAITAGAASGPGNDNPGGAKVVGSLPYRAQQNTGGATTSDLERGLNDQCGAPALAKGVWFKYTAGSDLRLRISAVGSSYSVGLLVTRGAPANAAVVACGGFEQIVQLAKGTTYWILAFDFTPGSAGGTLRLAAAKAAPLPSVDVTVKRGVAKPSTGVARLFGTASCKGTGSQLVFVGGQVVQDPNSPNPVFGGFFMSLTVQCGNTPIHWQADAFPEPIFGSDPTQPPVPTQFKPGPVSVDVQAAACNAEGQCADVTKSLSMKLTKP